ncbi:putative Tetratricopeptide repeat [Trypanosoma vivax]|uniref:Uncharacterized protein n=1 Tax=Trypanosoma vivax (strain Y486) TaxID=1055687 RepID=G0U2Y9_TRYVY|nr:hypothetical protein TRVL_08350 [Trypanosoma vivax]KAH8604170.1 putative Tetratricopeptide repeat [Trypanosoma vivax]CCC50644.1 conserved hypothetical protein [Trypanosoma vivax Y486]
MSHSKQGWRTPAARVAIKENNDVLDIENVGWASLESKFDDLMRLMDMPTSGINALAARSAHCDQVGAVVVQLLNRAQDESRRLLVEGNGEAAAETGVKVLRLKEKFYGKKNIRLVPAYFHLARTHQFLGRFGNAEEMLSLSQLIILQNPNDADAAVKAELHQTFGLLYATDNKLEAAVKHLACATYYMSVLNGPEHVLTTFVYFDLANVFATKANMESAMALYDTVKSIWVKHLRHVLKQIVEDAMTAKLVKRYDDDDVEKLDGYESARSFGMENLADVYKMLQGILTIQRERLTDSHPTTAAARFVFGLYLIWVSNNEGAAEHLRIARAVSQKFYGEKHPVVQEIEEWCEWFEIPLEVCEVDNREPKKDSLL